VSFPAFSWPLRALLRIHLLLPLRPEQPLVCCLGIWSDPDQSLDLVSNSWIDHSRIRRKKNNVPTILLMMGWRISFCSNEGAEPIHVHCQRTDCEAKFWVDLAGYDFVEAYGYNMTPRDKRHEIVAIEFQGTTLPL